LGELADDGGEPQGEEEGYEEETGHHREGDRGEQMEAGGRVLIFGHAGPSMVAGG
jgi:hypothetical protein